MLIQGNAFKIPLPDKSVHMCVTSPPYYSLRKYAGEQEFIFGGDIVLQCTRCSGIIAINEQKQMRKVWSGDNQAIQDVQAMSSRVEEDKQKDSKEKLPSLQQGIQGKGKNVQPELRSQAGDKRGAMENAEHSRSLRSIEYQLEGREENSGEGVHIRSGSSGSPNSGIEEREEKVYSRTPIGDGKTARAVSGRLGKGASQERGEGRQSDREFGIGDSEDTQGEREMPALSRMVLDELECPDCNNTEFEETKCAHEWGEGMQHPGNEYRNDKGSWPKENYEGSKTVNDATGGNFCYKCNAWRGAYGLEPTLQMYIDHTVEWCREVHRVLRDDGIFFLNLGDSYMGSGKGLYGDGKSHGTEGKKQKTNQGSVGVPRVDAYGTSGKAPVDYQGRGCLCESLCDVCLVVHRHKSRKDDWLVPTLIASLSETTRERMGFEPSRLPTLDFSLLANRLISAILGLSQIPTPSDEQLGAFRESMPDEFSRQLLDECLQRDSHALCLWCDHSLVPDEPESVDNFPAHHSRNSLGKQNKTSAAVSPERRNQNRDKACEYCVEAYPDYTIASHLKQKDLMGVPWRVALALQADGWWLRSAPPWIKRNSMPESATDRPSTSHEYWFMLTKKKNYFWDMDAVRVGYTKPMDRWGGEKLIANGKSTWDENTGQGAYRDRDMRPNKSGRSRRTHDWWVESLDILILDHKNYVKHLEHIRDNNGMMLDEGGLPVAFYYPTKSYNGAHFATYNPDMIEPIIKASTSEKGVCPECGDPWERVVESKRGEAKLTPKTISSHHARGGSGVPTGTVGKAGSSRIDAERTTTGWRATCDHNLDPIPATVLDPFSGSGTSLLVARKLGRKGIGLDIAYQDLAKERLGIKNGLPGFEGV